MGSYSERISKKIISADKTIIQTMKAMDEAFTKLFLVFEGERFLGIITNGDLQRAIIANISFDTPIAKIVTRDGKLFAHKSDDRERIKEWMLSKRAELMPVLDDNGHLEDVIFWDDILSEKPNLDNRPRIDLPVVIMAGGKGTRLKPITNVIPKPLVPVGDKTILEVIMDQFESIGCRKFFMSLNYKADMIRYYLGQIGHRYDIEFFSEDKPLGTIGSVSLLKGRIDTPFFVSNCDCSS